MKEEQETPFSIRLTVFGTVITTSFSPTASTVCMSNQQAPFVISKCIDLICVASDHWHEE